MEKKNIFRESFLDGLVLDGGTKDISNYVDAEKNDLFKDLKKPKHKSNCVCGVKIQVNCYIIHKENLDIHIVGRCCIKRFLDKGKQNKTCQRCFQPHKNTSVGYCNDCRDMIKNHKKEQDKAKEKHDYAIALIITFNEKDEAKKKARESQAYLAFDGDCSIFNKKTWYTLSYNFSQNYPKNKNVIKNTFNDLKI